MGMRGKVVSKDVKVADHGANSQSDCLGKADEDG